MRIVDVNVLLYAVNESAPQHEVSKSWLDRALSGTETVLLPWVNLLAFVRITTHPRIFEHPRTLQQAVAVVEAWLSAPNVITGEPDRQHLRRLTDLLSVTGTAGNLVNDAHLAALAQGHDATVMSFDRDFGRFAGVKWELPH